MMPICLGIFRFSGTWSRSVDGVYFSICIFTVSNIILIILLHKTRTMLS